MIRAAFPMYDFPSLQGAWQGLWHHIWQRLCGQSSGLNPFFGPAPELVWNPGKEAIHQLWCSPDLILSQSCGYPLRYHYHNDLEPLAAPIWQFDDVRPGFYHSLVIARCNDRREHLERFRGCIAAYNDKNSQSGFNALRALIAPLARCGCFFSGAHASGSHQNSMQLVASGKADLAAIDRASFAFIKRDHPELARKLRIITRTADVPALPFVTHKSHDRKRTRMIANALIEAISEPACAPHLAQLGISGLQPVRFASYQPICDQQAFALAHGYASLD